MKYVVAILISLLGNFQNAGATTPSSDADPYRTDFCVRPVSYSTSREFLGQKFDPKSAQPFEVCEDGSASFKQPASLGLFGWEGKCGATAMANTLKMTCGKAWSPSGWMDLQTSDLGPGVHPKTFEKGLNRFGAYSGCHGTKWRAYSSATSREAFILSLVNGLTAPSSFYRIISPTIKVRRAPVPVLVYYASKKLLHWVTVVDVQGYEIGVDLSKQKSCKVVFNQYDDQDEVSCEKFAELAESVGDAYYVAGLYIGNFIRIKQVRP